MRTSNLKPRRTRSLNVFALVMLMSCCHVTCFKPEERALGGLRSLPPFCVFPNGIRGWCLCMMSLIVDHPIWVLLGSSSSHCELCNARLGDVIVRAQGPQRQQKDSVARQQIVQPDTLIRDMWYGTNGLYWKCGVFNCFTWHFAKMDAKSMNYESFWKYDIDI